VEAGLRLLDPQICVCIPTHRRPAQLERLLTSLLEQQGAPSFEVIIVDNDAARSAEPIADKFRSQLSLTYLVEPIRGLSRVRNRAVGASDLKYIAFIDDDHCASPRWLASHYQIAIQTGAAAVVGRSIVSFDNEVPDFIRDCGHFNERQYSDGETVPWHQATFANCIVRRDALPSTSPFSENFDLTGGEDVDLFYRMIAGGARVVAASQASTISYRPASRANLFWVMRRAFRNGGTIVEICWPSFSRKKKIGASLNAAVSGTTSAVRGAWLCCSDRTSAVQHLVIASQEFGKLVRLLGIRVKEYRHHH
jgi:succinoglycan biosynthesis protein ExoM